MLARYRPDSLTGKALARHAKYPILIPDLDIFRFVGKNVSCATPTLNINQIYKQISNILEIIKK